MALTIFVSSTIRFLGNAREYIRNAIIELGHEPIMSEFDEVGYLSNGNEPLENSCYGKIKRAQVVIAIIDDYFGSTSKIDDSNFFSISNMELQMALKEKKQVYIFISERLHSLYEKWTKANDETAEGLTKENTYKYYGVDLRIFEFVKFIYASTDGKIYINKYLVAADIVNSFKKQLSGLLELLLSPSDGSFSAPSNLQSVELKKIAPVKEKTRKK
jgi:Domain of unknown function (DUF4062)